MPLSFPTTAQSACMVERSPWTASDAHVGLLGLVEADFITEEPVQGGPRRPGGLARCVTWHTLGTRESRRLPQGRQKWPHKL